MELLDFNRIKLVIDWSCGNGILTKKLKDRSLEAIEIDLSPEFLAAARKQYSGAIRAFTTDLDNRHRRGPTH